MHEVKNFDYTLNMQAVFQNTQSELGSYYCREDFECLLDECDSAEKDRVRFARHDLSNLCKARGIDTGRLLKDRSLLSQIPPRSEIKDKLLCSFYEMYKEARSPAEYMERIVRHLAPEYSSDSVRVAILKKFIVGGGKSFKRFDISPILNWAENRLSAEQLTKYRKASDNEKTDILLSAIDDTIFERERVTLSSAEILKLIIGCVSRYRVSDNIKFDEIVLSDSTKAKLSEILSSRADCADKTNSELLELLAGSETDTAFDEAVSLIDNDFREQLKTVVYTTKTGREETADSLYKEARKTALKSKKAVNNPDTELIAMCDSLAHGSFRVNGKTKTELYYFAFMFGMTVRVEGRAYDPDRDVEKKLFHDFYNNSMLNVLSDMSNPTAIDKEPTGEGINYKNYAEMIYIYFLCKDGLNMTPGEKIDKAESIINHCVNSASKHRKKADTPISKNTKTYRDEHLNALLDLSPDKLADYISDNYHVLSDDNTGLARIMIASDENTASSYADELIDKIDSAYPNATAADILQRKASPNEITEDIKYDSSVFVKWELRNMLEEKYASDTDFLKVVRAIDKKTHIPDDRFNRSEREEMLAVLHALSLYSSEKSTLSSYRIESIITKSNIIKFVSHPSKTIGVLVKLGFKIEGNADGYYLAEKKYDDPCLAALIAKVSKKYFFIDDNADLLMKNALLSLMRSDKRITRCELISLHYHYYISQIDDTVDTFPDVFKSYSDDINDYLEGARYQPLSHKNIFDMYIVTSLYIYLTENCGYKQSITDSERH